MVPTGEIRKAYVFVAGLGFSQLVFAWAAEDTRSRNWLTAHRRMFPARAGHAKDKALVEGLVKILMRYVRFRHRRQRFTSLPQLNIALRECVVRINSRSHSRLACPGSSASNASRKPL
jgi:transposase